MTIFYPIVPCKRAVAYPKQEYRLPTEHQADRPIKEELGRIIAQSGIDSKKFFNTSGQLYRSLGLKDKLPGLDADQILDLLSSDGMLVKRPLLVCDATVLVGFRQAEWDAFFAT